MKNSIFYITLIAIMAATVLASCKGKKDNGDDIIVEKVVKKPQTAPESMERDERNGSVKWISGAQYTYNIVRRTNDSLAIVENHGRKYHGNEIELKVFRTDGSVFFKKTFTKANFAPALPEQFKDNGVLLGMNFEKAEGNDLRFIVSVGSPDDSNEEFYYVIMKLSNYGATSLDKYAGADAADNE